MSWGPQYIAVSIPPGIFSSGVIRQPRKKLKEFAEAESQRQSFFWVSRVRLLTIFCYESV